MGIVEAREVNISSKIPGRIEEIRVREGDRVTANDLVIVLEGTELRAQLKQVEADLASARAQLLMATVKVESTQARQKSAMAHLEKALIAVEESKRNLTRLSALFSEGVIAQSVHDAARAQFQTAEAHVTAARAERELSDTEHQVARAQREQAEAVVNQGEASVDLFRVRLSETFIRNPLSGVVVHRYFEPGEMVSPATPLLTVVDFEEMWVRVDLDEREVGQIRLGDQVTILGHFQQGTEFKGKVTEIGAEGEFATQRDVRRGRQDMRTFRVKVSLTNQEGILKPGMTVTVVFGGV